LNKVFVEYSIDANCRELYLTWIKEKTQLYPCLEVLQSTAQSGLFLEIWTEVEGVSVWSKLRRDPNSAEWGQLLGWVSSPANKLNIWEFERL
jgi:hypothetical protein